MRFCTPSPTRAANLLLRRVPGTLGLLLLGAVSVNACAPADAGEIQDPVAEALSAAPPAIAATATVTTMEGEVLRQGEGEYTCIAVPDAPMCLDATWLAWFEAYVADTQPAVGGLGISYMLAGDVGASNIDPRATGPAADNEWVVSGPHLMLLVPDAAALDVLPTDPAQGGPYVMWKGTPYAHVMVPVPAANEE